MTDWMFEVGQEPLPTSLPDQPWLPDQGPEAWLVSDIPDDLETWLAMPQPKGGFEDFGPMFTPAEDEDATELDDVVVVGERWPGSVQVTIGDVGEPPVGEGGDNGGSGGGPDLDPSRPYGACEDRQADTLADDINDDIRKQPDSDKREYGALIWRDAAGNLHRTELVPGSNGNVNWPADPSELGLDSYSRVVGMVHSHPSLVNLGTDVSPNWVSASHGWIHGGDWAAADWWVSTYNLNTANFAMYIAYQGQIREYDYADNRSVSRDEPTYRGSEESGDYNPGQSCP